MIKPDKLRKETVDMLLKGMATEYKHSYFYQSASNWCKGVGLVKAGDYFLGESTEEISHARKFEQYLVDWNVIPNLQAIEKPQTEFKNLLEIIEIIYENEISLYEEYTDICKKLLSAGDIGAFNFMQFYIDAQKKSVTTYSDMLNLLEGTNVNDKFQMLLLEEKLF